VLGVDGDQLAQARATFSSEPSEEEAGIAIPFGFMVELPRIGHYSVELRFDDETLTRLPLEALQGTPG
jgi:hypothetical protein